jgi:two-component system sensor histidine kinase KdpD
MQITLRDYSRWSRLLAHVMLALVVTLLASFVLYALRKFIDPLPIALLYLLPVGLCAALWGLEAGLASGITAFLGLNYFFIEPLFTFFVHQSQDLIVLLVFLGVATFISQMVGRTRNSLAVARASEHDAVRLYKFSAELAELHDDRLIAESIARQVHETFRALRVEVAIQEGSAEQVYVSGLQRESVPTPSNTSPSVRVPLNRPDGYMGEIRVWRVPAKFTFSEERLLQTFSYQGVLALERSRLIQAETRAQILEESDRMKTSLLSSVSHELRTPLATIKAASTSLSSGAVEWDGEARSELLLAIEEETDHLNLLVGNLLDMSRIQTGAFKPEQRWNALDEIIENVQNRTRTSARNHRLDVDVSQDLPLVFVDDVQIGQVFINLISNSLKYAPEHTVVRIHAHQQEGDMIKVQVSNEGPAVPEEELSRIFEKFHRITAVERVTGIGLGLSICKGIIEAHGGRIWAQNLPAGFAINFTLPISWQGLTPQIPKEHESPTSYPGN